MGASGAVRSNIRGPPKRWAPPPSRDFSEPGRAPRTLEPVPPGTGRCATPHSPSRLEGGTRVGARGAEARAHRTRVWGCGQRPSARGAPTPLFRALVCLCECSSRCVALRGLVPVVQPTPPRRGAGSGWGLIAIQGRYLKLLSRARARACGAKIPNGCGKLCAGTFYCNERRRAVANYSK